MGLCTCSVTPGIQKGYAESICLLHIPSRHIQTRLHLPLLAPQNATFSPIVQLERLVAVQETCLVYVFHGNAAR